MRDSKSTSSVMRLIRESATKPCEVAPPLHLVYTGHALYAKIFRIFRILEGFKGSFSAVSSSFGTSNSSFFRSFAALFDGNTPKTAKDEKYLE